MPVCSHNCGFVWEETQSRFNRKWQSARHYFWFHTLLLKRQPVTLRGIEDSPREDKRKVKGKLDQFSYTRRQGFLNDKNAYTFSSIFFLLFLLLLLNIHQYINGYFALLKEKYKIYIRVKMCKDSRNRVSFLQTISGWTI